MRSVSLITYIECWMISLKIERYTESLTKRKFSSKKVTQYKYLRKEVETLVEILMVINDPWNVMNPWPSRSKLLVHGGILGEYRRRWSCAMWSVWSWPTVQITKATDTIFTFFFHDIQKYCQTRIHFVVKIKHAKNGIPQYLKPLPASDFFQCLKLKEMFYIKSSETKGGSDYLNLSNREKKFWF